jgi:hypothetical protein
MVADCREDKTPFTLRATHPIGGCFKVELPGILQPLLPDAHSQPNFHSIDPVFIIL